MAGVAVVDRLGQLDGVAQDGVPRLDGEVLGRRDLHHLLVAALDGAVALVQVHDVAVVVAQELHLDVLGPVEEALDKDGAVAKGALSLDVARSNDSLRASCSRTTRMPRPPPRRPP